MTPGDAGNASSRPIRLDHDRLGRLVNQAKAGPVDAKHLADRLCNRPRHGLNRRTPTDDLRDLDQGLLQCGQLATGMGDPSELQLVADLAGESLKQVPLCRGESGRTRFRVDHAQAPDHRAASQSKWCTSIKAEMSGTRDQGVRGRLLVFGQVGDLQQGRLIDSQLANRLINRRLANVEADAGLEPLPLAVEQTDKGNRRVASMRCNVGDVVERLLCIRIEDMEIGERRRASDGCKLCRSSSPEPAP
jgi:hypothetical protein